jgi:tetratricopeptide (TPR) repeat protein
MLIRDSIAEGRTNVVAQIIPTWILRIRSSEDWAVLLELLEELPKTQLVNSASLVLAYSEALAKNSLYDQLLEFTSRAFESLSSEQHAQLLLFRSAALFAQNALSEAVFALRTALPYLNGESYGRALGRLGLTLFQLGQPWEDSFLQAKKILDGRAWGLVCLNFAYCLHESQRSQEARAVWLEAILLLKSDPFSLAWLRFNLGASYLKDLEFVEAERHYLEGQRLAGNTKRFSMHASILNGLASVRRARGEWTRAEFIYQKSMRVSNDSFDRVTTLIGLARTLLLAGRASEAVEVLELDLTQEDLTSLDIQVARALVFLHLNDLPRASAALETITTPIVGAYQWLERLCRAELARRHGQFTEAVQWLEGNPTHTLHMREEVRQWPELFALAKAAGLPIPEPLEYVQGSTVQVRARGVLHVAVNDRGVAVPPTGRVGELLVFLLEHEGEAPLDVILEAFYPNAVGSKDRARARKMVWEHANTLRELLGWQDAVIALGGAYQLDPQTTWRYDIREARALGLFNGEFLAGVYSEWALEVGQDLARFAVDSDAGVHLN